MIYVYPFLHFVTNQSQPQLQFTKKVREHAWNIIPIPKIAHLEYQMVLNYKL